MSLGQLVQQAKVNDINDRRNFESSSMITRWLKEDEQIKSFIYKMNIGKKLKIWKQPTFLDKTRQ